LEKKNKQEEEELRRILECIPEKEKDVLELFSVTGLSPVIKCRKNAAFYIGYNGTCTDVSMKVKMTPAHHVTVEVQDKKDGTFLVIFYPKISTAYSVFIECIEKRSCC